MQQVPEAPPGFYLKTDFVTSEQEAQLLDIFRNELVWPIRSTSSQKPQGDDQVVEGEKAPQQEAHGRLGLSPNLPPSRLSLHYGHHFCYKFFGIDTSIPYVPFPPWLKEVLPSFCPSSANHDPASVKDYHLDMPGRDPEQVCLQYYPPGAGIPPHADTHSAFESLMGLSLGSGVVMEFRRRQAKTGDDDVGLPGTGADGSDQEWDWDRREVFVPPRSLYNMSGDSQYHFQHGIKKRKNDRLIIPAPEDSSGDGVSHKVVRRGERFSITFRWVRNPAVCECGDEWLCDTAMRRNGVERVLRWKGDASNNNKS
ncbi:hypothetical protein MCOR27_003555 [Pyricularia oryzae]|uniref:Fe2OG dioxygenase domain-containing protein n=1 Tax=Pyricularia grisea TaxID=148305 RepID=A0ABQ8ND46_PYRGI|nr:hypothetical protein MCOR01_007428 [Pyricularia oryzae]KAI6295141.1 hypothetical protein MCOR33_007915 [Pyricularia grisea]KAI6260232.1 hypothetical protein MCOR19_003464 [Pyricularia oryzae]KAI6279527.1 hypothetical protein MCOR26_004155 [Pyricularia oryzae]KAI6282790.1 hypothetical protein MCOR27_003555 [Pyricularia oryzae]